MENSENINSVLAKKPDEKFRWEPPPPEHKKRRIHDLFPYQRGGFMFVRTPVIGIKSMEISYSEMRW
jgi:hypothetical protein